MGMPYWSVEEEEYFANVIIPQSRYATGVHVPNSGHEFADLAPRMQQELDRRGASRRRYTGDGLFQHWYQRFGKRAKERHQLSSDQPLTKATTPGGVTSLKKRNGTPSTQPYSTRRTPIDRRPDTQPVPRYANTGSQTRISIDPLDSGDGQEQMQPGFSLQPLLPSYHPDDVFVTGRSFTPPGYRADRSRFPGTSARTQDYRHDDEMDDKNEDTPSKPLKKTHRSQLPGSSSRTQDYGRDDGADRSRFPGSSSLAQDYGRGDGADRARYQGSSSRAQNYRRDDEMGNEDEDNFFTPTKPPKKTQNYRRKDDDETEDDEEEPLFTPSKRPRTNATTSQSGNRLRAQTAQANFLALSASKKKEALMAVLNQSSTHGTTPQTSGVGTSIFSKESPLQGKIIPPKRPARYSLDSASKRQKASDTARPNSSANTSAENPVAPRDETRSGTEAVMGDHTQSASQEQEGGMTMQEALRQALRMHGEGRLPQNASDAAHPNASANTSAENPVTQREEAISASEAVMGGHTQPGSQEQESGGMSMQEALRTALRMHREGRLPRTQPPVTQVGPSPSQGRGFPPGRQIMFGRRRGQLAPIYTPPSNQDDDVTTGTPALPSSHLGLNDTSYPQDPKLPSRDLDEKDTEEDEA